MKIIIVGCGKIGVTLAEQLNSEHHDITLIDSDGAALQAVTDRIDVMGVTGNGAVYQVQMEAGIKEADLLIATTNSDELNMLCCLIAKKAGKCHTSPAKAPKGTEAAHRNRISAIIRNLVSPPPRRTPLVRMEFIDWKMTIKPTASISCSAMPFVSSVMS